VPNNQASQWPILFDLAGNIFDHFQATNGFIPDWTFGGGTALMLQIDHRESHDIDLFLDDPQIIPYLNPERREFLSTDGLIATSRTEMGF